MAGCTISRWAGSSRSSRGSPTKSPSADRQGGRGRPDQGRPRPFGPRTSDRMAEFPLAKTSSEAENSLIRAQQPDLKRPKPSCVRKVEREETHCVWSKPKPKPTVQQEPDEARHLCDEHDRLGPHDCPRRLQPDLGKQPARSEGGRRGGIRGASRPGAVEA